MRILALGVCALALFAGSSNAQQAVGSAEKGPTLQAAAVGFRVAGKKVDALTKVNEQVVPRHQGQDVAFMAVGVGAMIAGALIEHTAGTIIIIAGAALALLGLYRYLE